MNKEIKKKIIEILENRVFGWREGVFTPKFFETSAIQILELFEQEKNKTRNGAILVDPQDIKTLLNLLQNNEKVVNYIKQYIYNPKI